MNLDDILGLIVVSLVGGLFLFILWIGIYDLWGREIKSLCKALKNSPRKFLVYINSWKTKIKRLIPKKWGGTKEKIMRKKVLDLTLEKRGMETVLHLKAAKEIEDFFKKASAKSGKSAKTETSSKWRNGENEGLVFYVKNEQLTGRVEGYGPVMDNFGNGLTDNEGKINLALLRIVGISSENGVTVKTDDLLGFQETKQYIEDMANWAKSFYEENLRDQDLVASVSFEV